MLKEHFAAFVLATFLVVCVCDPSRAAQAQGAEKKTENGAVTCRVVEAFEAGRLGVRAVVFHQRDRADGPRLGALLLAHSGEEMEFETRDGQRHRAPVFRVKSCFGRGLLVVPTSEVKLGEKDEFTLRLPEKN
ncbi:MAG: hypothetical protein LAO04_13875 [Acidobacteriia bacterium]|nr:hypothetical protein [Terriglobia bacterium]